MGKRPKFRLYISALEGTYSRLKGTRDLGATCFTPELGLAGGVQASTALLGRYGYCRVESQKLLSQWLVLQTSSPQRQFSCADVDAGSLENHVQQYTINIPISPFGSCARRFSR